MCGSELRASLGLGDGHGCDIHVSVDFKGLDVVRCTAVGEGGEAFAVGENLETEFFVNNG